jgi:uncharacterized metal-binding protein
MAGPRGATVTDPELIALLIAALRCVLRLTDALAQRLVLRGQAELIRTAAAAEAAVELSDTAPRGRAQRFMIKCTAARRQS